MASKIVQANTTAQEVFETPYDKIGKITFIEVDNRSSGSITITIQDVFTPFATDETPSPTEQTVNRKKLTVSASSSKSLGKDELEGLKILGTCKVVADTTSSDCDITIGYEFE